MPATSMKSKSSELRTNFIMNYWNLKTAANFLNTSANKSPFWAEEFQDLKLPEEFLTLIQEFSTELPLDGSGTRKFQLLHGDQFTI